MSGQQPRDVLLSPGFLAALAPTSTCRRTAAGRRSAVIRIADDSVGSAARLVALSHLCRPMRTDRDYLLSALERCVMQRIDSLFSSSAQRRELAVQPPRRGPGRDPCARL